MEDLGPYEAMRDAGATPLDVFLAAYQRIQNNVEAMCLLRRIFTISFEEACEVARAAAALNPPAPIEGHFSVFVIDPRTRAPAATPSFDEFLPPKAVAQLLGRPPTLERANFTSWGRLTRKEIEALIEAGYLDDMGELTRFPPEQVIWSLCYERHLHGG